MHRTLHGRKFGPELSAFCCIAQASLLRRTQLYTMYIDDARGSCVLLVSYWLFCSISGREFDEPDSEGREVGNVLTPDQIVLSSQHPPMYGVLFYEGARQQGWYDVAHKYRYFSDNPHNTCCTWTIFSHNVVFSQT